MNPPHRLSLHLLGGFALDLDAGSCKLVYEKGRALLAYLAAEPGRAHSRAFLAAMLWPDLEHDAALSNLRLVLHNLRQVINTANLAKPPLQIDRESVRLDPAADLEIDTREFTAPALACPATPCAEHCDPCLIRMETLVNRYQGEFMAGFSLPECPEYEEWLQVHREALHLRALCLLARLSECHERAGAYGKALPFARRFLGLEPWNEEGLRRAMRLFALNGQRASALGAYETCCLTLKKELGILPSEETTALAEIIRQGEPSTLAECEPDPGAEMALPLPVAERRQVTVLYCELATDGAEDLDEALALLRSPQAHCKEIISSFSGHLVRFHGGSLLAYFGYPQASENAARLAVQAALELTRAAVTGLELRVGVHTGVVICADLQVPDAIGATSGLAIRLRQLVEPGEVAISGATQHLVAGYFECMNLGLRQLRGIQRPLEVFRVVQESGARYRLEASPTLTPLVGRKKEMATLLAEWKEAGHGVRRIVLLCGEAGIGKSRLVLTLKEALCNKAIEVCELRCFPEHSHSPFFPLTALFELKLTFLPDETPEARFDKLAEYVETHFASKDRDVVPLLATMHSLPLRASYLKPDFSPQQQREKTMAILLDRLYSLAAKQALLLLVEDLHWADPSTLEFLKLFVEQQRTAPILAVFTARPVFEPPWQESLVSTLPLNALDKNETAMLIAGVEPGIAPAMVLRIVDRADGIPLFAEELTREMAANDRSAIPSTLQDLLASRLDGMGAAKITAQLASAAGREFSFDLLRRIAPFDDATLEQMLQQLQAAGLLQCAVRGVFNFRHALMRDAAYLSLTRAEREAVHRRIANALETGGSKVRPELLAQHRAAGGEIRQAVACWIDAGKLASQHSASREAVMHFKSGLTLLQSSAPGAERDRQELILQIGLGSAATSAHGYASAEGAEAYARAMALASRHESDPAMFPAIWGLWASASSRAGYAIALDLAQQLLRMANQSGDPVEKEQGHFAVANTLYWQGEFVMAQKHLERVSELYQPAQQTRHIADFGEAAGVTSNSYTSWVLWFLGFPEQALKVSAQALALARQIGHPFSLAYALIFASILNCRLRRPEASLTLAQEALNLASHHGFPLWIIGATLTRGWAYAMQGQRQGVESMQQCVEATREAMGGVRLVVLEPLVDAYAVLGRFENALSISSEAFAVGVEIGDHHIEAELHRLKGESLLGLAEGNEDSAEACFYQALTVSRRQQAKSLELRAAMSLARLWHRQGKRDDAQCLLKEVYNWFTEGLDTPDLLNARELLDSLIGIT